MYQDDRGKIREIFEEVYPQIVRSQDLAAYQEMYAEDAIWMPPNDLDRQGKYDIVQGFSEQMDQNDIDPVFTAEEIEVMADFGYVLGISIVTISPKDGSPSKQVKFRELWLMKKEDDIWKINRQIWNSKPL